MVFRRVFRRPPVNVMFLGESIDTADKEGMTSLLYACKNGQMRLARYLLENKQPSVESTDVQGHNCMHYLALLPQRPSLHKANNRFAAREGKIKDQANQDRLEVAELLLSRGCGVNAKASGVSAFYTACMEGDLDVVKLCIAYGAEADTIGEFEDAMNIDATPHEGNDADDMNVERWEDEIRPSQRIQDKRPRTKSFRERVNIFQRDREEEAIGESGKCIPYSQY